MSIRLCQLTLLALTAAAFTCSAADVTFAPREPRYHLHPGDVISVEYRYTPEYNATLSIQPDGYASLPLLGDLKLGGLTLTEVHDQLQAKAGERLNQPEITVGLKEFEKPYYIVGGEVGAPGRFEIRGRMTALRAIEMAGGFRTSGKTSQILLIRPVNGVDAETKLINLKSVLNYRQLNEDVELHPGDMLVVPKTRLAKVEPYIRLFNPGSFGLYVNPSTF